MRLLDALTTVRLPRRSLLFQLLGVYLLFVALVLGIDLKINGVAQQQVKSQVQTTDLALAQEIALQTDNELGSNEQALINLSRLPAVRRGDVAAMKPAFEVFKEARYDIDLVYWLTPDGTLTASVPTDFRTLGADFSNQAAFQEASAEKGPPRPVMEDGVVDLTTFHAVVTLALPVRWASGRLVGIVATNIRLRDLNQAFQSVVDAQRQQHQHLVISIVDRQGRLIGTAQRERLLQPALADLPGADAALAGRSATREGTDAQGARWLYSSVPIRGVGWAVVVQRSAVDALSVVTDFQRWIFIAAAIFAAGGLLFWLVLLVRVVRPLRVLARRHAALPADGAAIAGTPTFIGRADEVGKLARSLSRLEHDVVSQLSELHTLLETSNAVVTSLDPIAVGRTIIEEVQRLVDIQAAAVFVPDEDRMLRVLVSEGRPEWHDQAANVSLDDPTRPAVQALREGRPVQMVAGEDEPFPPLSLSAGFRAVLAIPIISRHVGGVVLVVHRVQARRFTEQEVELLLTFANYATLAWEHAVLYERSDERLREIAAENERLYQEANAEKQILASLLAAVGHELRTPLAVIKGNVSTLLQHDVSWSPGDQAHFLRTVSTETDRLAQLVTNLLDLSRLEAGLLLLRRGPFSLEELVESAVRRVHVPIPDLVIDLPADLPPIDIDRQRVEVVLHNLIENAVAYGNGRVEVTAEPKDGEVVVHVADNGPGIAKEELPHIFERFYRAQHGSLRRSTGTGLGLAISRAFVEAHGGTIWAESGRNGTVISLSLPTPVQPAESGPTEPARAGSLADARASGGGK